MYDPSVGLPVCTFSCHTFDSSVCLPVRFFTCRDLFVRHPSVCLFAWCPNCDASVYMFTCRIYHVLSPFVCLCSCQRAIHLSSYLFSCHRYNMHLSVDMFICRMGNSFVRRRLSVCFSVTHVRSICLYIGQIYCTSFRWHQKVEGEGGLMTISARGRVRSWKIIFMELWKGWKAVPAPRHKHWSVLALLCVYAHSYKRPLWTAQRQY
jgi:hypothetical protein